MNNKDLSELIKSIIEQKEITNNLFDRLDELVDTFKSAQEFQTNTVSKIKNYEKGVKGAVKKVEETLECNIKATTENTELYIDNTNKLSNKLEEVKEKTIETSTKITKLTDDIGEIDTVLNNTCNKIEDFDISLILKRLESTEKYLSNISESFGKNVDELYIRLNSFEQLFNNYYEFTSNLENKIAKINIRLNLETSKIDKQFNILNDKLTKLNVALNDNTE